jgi:hypothetical protein
MQARTVGRRALLALALVVMSIISNLPPGGTVVNATAASSPPPPRRAGDPDMPDWGNQPGPTRPIVNSAPVALRPTPWQVFLRWIARGGRGAS